MVTSVILISLISFLPVVIFTLLYKAKTISKSKNLPPGPSSLPIVGNLFQLDDKNLHTCLYNLSSRFGPILSLKLGYRQCLIISSAKMAREALKDNDIIFASRPLLTGLYTMSYFGNDLAFAEYKHWREMRKLTTIHIFNLKRVKAFSPFREDEIRRMLKKIVNLAAESRLVDLSALTMSLTCNIICRAAFGKRYEQNGEDAKRFHDLLLDTQRSFGAFYFRDYFPFMGWLDVVNGSMSRLKSIFKRMDDFYQQIIDEHLDPDRPKPDEEDFIDVMIGINKNSKDLTWDQIKGVLMNVFVAGVETSASSLLWGMCLLVMNPNILKKATDEISSVVGRHKEYIDEEDVAKLPYLKAVVKETMRMYMAAPLLVPKETTHESTIGGYIIPAKTLVYVNAWAIGRDPNEWEKPHEFNPDRFLGKDLDFKGTNFELIPFGAGRRICPGIHMGSMNVEVGLANLLNAFDWKLPDGMNNEDIDMSTTYGIVKHKRAPLLLAAKKYVSA